MYAREARRGSKALLDGMVERIRVGSPLTRQSQERAGRHGDARVQFAPSVEAVRQCVACGSSRFRERCEIGIHVSDLQQIAGSLPDAGVCCEDPLLPDRARCGASGLNKRDAPPIDTGVFSDRPLRNGAAVRTIHTCNRERTMSGKSDKVEGKTDQAVGEAKEKAGKAVDDKELEGKGKAQQVEGHGEEAKGKVKDSLD